MEVCHIGGSGIGDLLHQLAGRPPISAPARSVELPSIEPTADGWVGVNTNTRQQFESFLLMIGRSDLLEADESWAYAATRNERMEEWNEIVRSWTLQRSSAEIVELASELRIPVAPVGNGRTVLDHPHFADRAVWAQSSDETFTYPLPPYKIDGRRPRPRGDAPKLGEHRGSGAVRERRPHDASRSPVALPLTGVRVIDATAWWAGPSSTLILAALGADVIHLESVQHLDGARTVAGAIERPDWWERSPMFLRGNSGKRDLTIDLGSPRGKELLKLLIERADVLVENFSPRVFENFGITWESVSAMNPRLVMVRMPAFGLDGPWRDNVGFAQTMEQVTGMAWVTGHEYDQPRVPRGPCDPLAGMTSAFTALLGLVRRDQTGRGSFIEVAMVEAALNAAAEQVVEYTAYGTVLSRCGNRSRDAAPQGLYPCRGREEWLAISITTDTQWQALREALGHPRWAHDPDLGTMEGRRRAHDAIDRNLEAWARRHDVAVAVEMLVAKGIPAAELRDVRLSAAHPQAIARGFFEVLDHPVVGSHAVPGPPFRFASVANWCRTPAPTLGEHNNEVLAELGLDDATIQELADLRVIGSRPVGVDEPRRPTRRSTE
jgi:crotonobetainyl-CoA:carnitine CoA-transferase CaiB-like acyl-CoA transferase